MALTRKFAFLFLFFVQVLSASIPTPDFKPDLTVNIPMRDGVELPTDLYLPCADAKDLPCVLIRSPAGRSADFAKLLAYLTKHGYVVAIQDTRSVMDTAGKTLPYWSDGWGKEQDGYDTVTWLANSEYTNGKIGTVGYSALGITQMFMGPTAPEALKCQYIGMSASNLRDHAIYPGGQLLKNQIEGWLGLYAKDPSVKSFVMTQKNNPAFWNMLDCNSMANKVNAPALHYGGWYDTFVQGTIDGYVARQNNGATGAKGEQVLLIGPWTHYWPLSNKLGDFDIPAIGMLPPVNTMPERWFDYFLKGIDNGVDKLPEVIYYVMGPFDGSPSKGNVWRQTNVWPVPAQDTAFYLNADKLLAENDKPSKENKFGYVYDAKDPVPTIGGCNLFLESGPKDQRPLEQRKDVVVFTTAPLKEDTEVTGHLFAKLFVAADQPEFDVVVRLTDVYPDGRSILIADGLKHVSSVNCEKATASKDPQEVAIDLWSTSMVFAKGHQIRISVSGSNYPRYEKIGGDNLDQPSINQTLFVGENTPSRVILPIVREVK